MKTSTPQPRERKKARTAVRGKRYKCAVCRKRSPKATVAPYHCPAHNKKLDSEKRAAIRTERDLKTFIR